MLIGGGPVEYELTPEFLFWFEHGEQDYPAFQCPSIGPPGAGLKMSSRSKRIVANEGDVLCMIEISLVQPVDPRFPNGLESEQDSDLDEPPTAVVQRLQEEATAWLEQAIGLYALYEYPIVWEPLGVHPIVGFVDLESKTFRLTTRLEADNFIPFRLNVAAKVIDGELRDEGLVDLGQLADGALRLPLALLQRSLWHRNIDLRFLETFLILDYLTGQRLIEDEGRAEREEMFKVLDEFIRANHPKFQTRLNSLKHVILQAALRQGLDAYFKSLGMDVDGDAIARLLKMRNDIAHARKFDRAKVADAELEVRRLAREAMRWELANRGIRFEKRISAS